MKNRFQNLPFKFNLQRYTVDVVGTVRPHPDPDARNIMVERAAAAAAAVAAARAEEARALAGAVRLYKLNAVYP